MNKPDELFPSVYSVSESTTLTCYTKWKLITTFKVYFWLIDLYFFMIYKNVSQLALLVVDSTELWRCAYSTCG